MSERPHDYRRYKYSGCRCFRCRIDKVRYEEELAAGRGPRAMNYMPVALVREHLARLSARGVGYRRVAEVAGVDHHTVRRWLFSDAVLCRREVGEKILAVPDTVAPRRFHPATGAHRRIQALAAAGWPLSAAARRGDQRRHFLLECLDRSEIYPSTFAKVCAIYAELWNERPPASGWVPRVRELARTNRWFTAGAWDDDTIDDPDALPCLLPPVEAVDRDLELAVQHVVAGHVDEPDRDVVAEIVRRMPDRKPKEIAALARCRPGLVSDLRERARRVSC